jgi:hypothetical protein
MKGLAAMSHLRLFLFWLAISSFLIGCVTTPQAPIALSGDAIARHDGRVGVVMSALPNVDTSFPGADCLLCLGVASAANSALTSHTHTLGTDEVRSYKANLIDALRKKGFDVTDIPGPLDLGKLPSAHEKAPGHATKDFTSLKARFGVDRLYVLEVTQLGFERSYAAYVPTSDPQAIVRGQAYLIDLSSNAYDWYQPVKVTTTAEGKWDEPPAFPGLTNAYYQAIEKARDLYLGPFKN